MTTRQNHNCCLSKTQEYDHKEFLFDELLQAPFNSSHFNSVLQTHEKKRVYRCGQNFFRHNLVWSPTSGVPWLGV